MRKKLGILLLIFCLFLFFPTQKSYGQHNLYMPDVGSAASGALVYILLIPLAVIYDLSTDRCVLNWHSGDYYYEKNFKIIKPINFKIQKCYNKCIQKSMNQNVGMGSVRNYEKDETGNFNECFNPCFKEAMKTFPTSVASCSFKESDDYYTDGSYYKPQSTNQPWLHLLFTNKHKLRDKYEKTDWQKARDECMEITSKKKIFFETMNGQFQRLFALYNDCLKERGY